MSQAERTHRALSRATLWNLAGAGLPAIIGLAAVPMLVHRLGVERFGLLSVCWLIVGYFSLLDMGLSRALTREVARIRMLAAEGEVASLIGSAGVVATSVAAIVGVLLLPLVGTLVTLLHPSDAVVALEARATLFILAGSLPAVVASIILNATFEGYQRFDLVNLVRIPAGVLNLLAPLAVASFTPTLPPVVLSVVACRVLQLAALFWLCKRVVPGWPRHGATLAWHRVVGLLQFGKWLTVTNVVGPLMVYFDRFLISFTLGSSMVAFYTAPYDVLARTWLIPEAICSAMFAVLASVPAGAAAPVASIYRASFVRIAAMMTPLTVAIVLFAPELLMLWLGETFAARSADLTRLLAAGVLVNSLGRIPFTHVQSAGRADWSAKVHLTELLPYFAALWFAARTWGLEGVAAVWLLRIAVDAVIFYNLAAALRPSLRAELARQSTTMLALLAGIGAITAWAPGLLVRLALFAAIGVGCALAYRHLRPRSAPGPEATETIP